MTVDFIGIGTTKSASTWIFQCLSEHPDICGSIQKEVGFFSDPFRFQKGTAWYLEQFKHYTKGQTCGEFSPFYIESPEVAQKIKNLFPHVKIIALFRNPIDRLYSLYWFSKFDGSGSFAAFDTFEDILDPVLGITERMSAGKQMLEYYRLFSRDQIYTMLYDDIREDPQQIMSDLYTFLGVDATFIAPSTHTGVNETGEKKIRFPWLHKVIFRLFWGIKKIPWMYAVIKKINTQRFLDVLVSINITRGDTKFKKPPMNPETKKRLQVFFKEDIQVLEKLIHKDLSHWYL